WSAAVWHLDRVIAARPRARNLFYQRALYQEKLDQWEAAVRDYTQALALGEKTWEVWNNRGVAHLHLSHWKEAAADFEKVLTLPGEGSTATGLTRLSRARAYQGDAAGYRRACSQLVAAKQFKEAAAALLTTQVRVCVLAPDALADPQQVVQLAERAFTQDKTALGRNTLGAALYRAGQWQQAVEVLDQNAGAGAAFDWLFLAMA